MRDDSPIIIIPDVHQNFRFIEKILDNADSLKAPRILFLGDFFDSKEVFFGTDEALFKTLALVCDLVRQNEFEVQLLLGNHDVLYYYNRDECGLDAIARNELHQYYGTPDRQKLSLIRSMDLASFWNAFQLVTFEQGYLLSHAGITFDHWSKRLSLPSNIEEINRSIGLLMNQQGELNFLFRAGFARGGDLSRGGPLWLDWNREFTEEIGIPQIVGHTVGKSVRQNGRSYCLDAQQSCFGVLEHGILRIVEV